MNSFWNIVLIVLAIIVVLLYFVAIPMAKRKNMKQAQTQMKEFYDGLNVDETVVLADGIQGKIKNITGDIYQIEIAPNVTVTVNKFGIVNKVEN